MKLPTGKNFGAGRSNENSKRAQNLQLSHSLDFYGAKFLPGSIQAAFEPEKHKIQINPLSRLRKVLGRIRGASS